MKLKPMLLNPYNFGACKWFVFLVVMGMPSSTTIKLASVKTRVCAMKDYHDKTISGALCDLSRDGYLKVESVNANGETIYIKEGQVKNV